MTSRSQLLQALVVVVSRAKRRLPSASLALVRHFGGTALVPLAVLDSSIIPTFGSLDLLTGWLAVGDPDLWWYYAVMSTAGSLVGALITYRMGQKMGGAWIEEKIGRKRTEQVRSAVEHHGTASIFVSTIAPPPFPTSWFFVAAGAFSFPRRRFITASLLGRALRYSLLTLIAARFGRNFLRYLRHPLHYLLISVINTASLVGAALLFGKQRPARQSSANAGS
jgi:membrane protein YqaA with SNARE-associated domain